MKSIHQIAPRRVIEVMLFCMFLASPNVIFAQVPPQQDQNAAASVNSAIDGGLKIASPNEIPTQIKIEKDRGTLDERLKRKITLDIRDMNMVDVIKFLSIRGDFNVVTNPTVQGRVTLFLKDVSIKDALDIVLISNNLAFVQKNDIIHIMTEAEFLTIFGRKFNEQKKVEIIHLKYAKPSYVLTTLDTMKSAIGRIIIDEDTGSVVLIDSPEVVDQMTAVIKNLENPMEVFVYKLQYAKADVIAEKLKARVDAHAVGSVTADERSNQIIVRAIPGRRLEVEKLIKELDSKTKEVLIEARVLQLTIKPTMDVGIDWTQNFKDSSDVALKRLTFQNVFLNDASPATPLNSIFSKIAIGDITADHFQASLRALSQITETKILSNPKLLVTNNEEAKIHIGDTVPYIISTTSGTGDNAITSEDVRFVDVGLKLNVTPTINDEGQVTMRLKPEISTVVDKITSKGGGIPQVNKTEVETTVMVKDGTSIVLAGLKKDDKTHIKKGIPYVMNIPFLGKLFSSSSDSITTSEIIIFMTPHIVSGSDDYSKWRGSIKPYKSYEDEMDDKRKKAEMQELMKLKAQNLKERGRAQ